MRSGNLSSDYTKSIVWMWTADVIEPVLQTFPPVRWLGRQLQQTAGLRTSHSNPARPGWSGRGPRDLASLHTAQPRQDTAWRSGGHTAAAGAGV